MTFKEFVRWCNERSCDGCWSYKTALYCIAVMDTIRSEYFWRRNKVWKQQYEDYVVSSVVEPINKKIRELR